MYHSGCIFSGDTIKYDIKFFTNGTENNLGDVLRKIPGVALGLNNQIEYNGKRIDALLIEGRDVLNNQHKLATEGISSTEILSIHIIQRYQSFSQKVFQGINEQIAINVVLKETAKGDLKGQLDGSLGYKYKQKSGISLFKINKNSASTIFLRSNNIGETVISQNDYLSVQSDLTHENQNNTGIKTNILPDYFNISFDVNKNFDLLFSGNGEIANDSNNTLTKYSLLTGSMDRVSQNNLSCSYFNENNTIEIKNENIGRFSFGNLSASFLYKPNSKIQTEINILTDISYLQTKNNTQSEFFTSLFNSGSNRHSLKTNVQPALNFTYGISKYWYIKLQESLVLKSINENNNYTVDKGILDTGNLAINQNINNNIMKYKHTLQLFYISKNFDGGIEHTVLYNQDKFRYNNFLLFPGHSLYDTSALVESISSINSFLTYKFKDFFISPTFSFPYKIERNLGLKKIKNMLFNPSLNI